MYCFSELYLSTEFTFSEFSVLDTSGELDVIGTSGNSLILNFEDLSSNDVVSSDGSGKGVFEVVNSSFTLTASS